MEQTYYIFKDGKLIEDETKVDKEKVIEAYESNLNKSINGKFASIKKIKNIINTKNIAVMLTALIALGVISGKINKNNDVKSDDTSITQNIEKDEGLMDSISDFFNQNSKNSDYSMENISKLIGSLVYKKGMDFNPNIDSEMKSILLQSSFRIDENNYGLNHDKMASLMLEAETIARSEGFSIIEIGTCSLFDEMGKDRDIKPIPDIDKTNAELFLYSLKMKDTDNILKEFLGNADTLEKLYEGLGYKSFEEWKEAVNDLNKNQLLYEHLMNAKENIKEQSRGGL